MRAMTHISIVVPARNEEVTLPHVLADINKVIDELPSYTFETVVVDDHSTDRTADIARSFGARVVANMRSGGKGHALRAGFEAAEGDLICMMDADCSHRAEDLPLFLQAMKRGVGLVIGSRVVGGSQEYTHVRALGNVFLSAALGLATGRYLSDALNGYKLFRRDVFTDFTYTSRTFEIEVELVANAMRKGYQIVEVSSNERARAGGQAKSRVIRHGTMFLTRIIFEGLRGVTPAHVPTAAPAIESEAPSLSAYARGSERGAVGAVTEAGGLREA
jgi:glycosyltransferase involved in cell wall biosynthesis